MVGQQRGVGEFGSIFRILTTDKKYKLLYIPATGSPTVGEAYFVLNLAGPGIIAQPALTGPIVQP